MSKKVKSKIDREFWAMPPAVVCDGTLRLRNDSIDLLGVEDGEYRAAVELVNGEVKRVVIDFSPGGWDATVYGHVDGATTFFGQGRKAASV